MIARQGLRWRGGAATGCLLCHDGRSPSQPQVRAFSKAHTTRKARQETIMNVFDRKAKFLQRERAAQVPPPNIRSRNALLFYSSFVYLLLKSESRCL